MAEPFEQSSASEPEPKPKLARYHRQMLLPGFDADAQRTLSASTVVIVGCGALGTVAAESLVRAGVGRVRIIDRDIVELTNLQRQTLFTQRDAEEGVPKAAAAADRLTSINPTVQTEPIIRDLTPANAESLLTGAGAVIDATDNFQTRYLLNDACVKLGHPLLYGGVIATRGMAMTILPRSPAHAVPATPTAPAWDPTPCLRCVFPDPPAPGTTPTCDTAGVLGPVAGIVANVQAIETLKVLLGRWSLVSRTLLEFDPWHGSRRRIDLKRMLDPDCPCCAQRRFEHLDSDAANSASLCGRDAIQLAPARATDTRINLFDIADRLTNIAISGRVHRSPHLVRAALSTPRGQRELTVFADGRAIIKGTTDPAEARGLYARFIGS